MFIGFSVSLPRMKNIATIVANRPKARTTSGKKIQASDSASRRSPRWRRRHAEDHGADVLGGGRLEEVRAAAGAVADVVTDEVGNDARITRIVLGNARLDLANQVRADVGGLGVNPAESWAKRATPAPKPNPTMRNGASATVTSAMKVW